MKQFFSLVVIAACMCGMQGCGNGKVEQKQAEQPDTALVETPVPGDGIQRMQPSHIKDTVSWRKAVYTYEIERMVDDGLPTVADEQQAVFADNRIELVVKRGDEAFFSATFTKSTFTKQLDEGFLKNGLLEGLVFDKVTADGLQFAASVCYPQSDLFMPLLVIISPQGTMTIKKDTVLDTEGSTDPDAI